MGIEAIIVTLLILGVLVLSVSEVWSVDLISIGAIVVLVSTQILSPSEALAGFSNNAVITIAAMFPLSYAILRSGLLNKVSYFISKMIQKSELLGLGILMVCGAGLSAFLNNTPVVAIMIPVVLQASKIAKISSSKFLIPLSYATILGGTTTLIGSSTNLVVADIAAMNQIKIDLFDLTPIGLIFLVVGILYMTFIGKKFLPKDSDTSSLDDKYKSGNFQTIITLLDSAESIGQPIYKSPLITQYDMDIIEVMRDEGNFIMPPKDMILKENDRVRVRFELDKFKEFHERIKNYYTDRVLIEGERFQESDSTLLEIMIQPGSELIGESLQKFQFRRKFRGAPLAIRHREEIIHTDLLESKLQAGDIILIEMKTVLLEELKVAKQHNALPFVILTENIIQHNPSIRPWIVSIIMLSFILLASFKILPIVSAALVCTFALIATKTITTTELYKSINWNIIFMLAGLLSLATAMQKTSLDVFIADSMIQGLGDYSPVILISVLYIVTSLLTELLSNNATAALLAPIAIQIAHSTDSNPTAFIMAVLLAASCSFLTPMGYQTNTMVYAAGNYKYTDFFKAGIGLNIILWLIASALLPILFPL